MLESAYAGKRILVTGGTGSIGREIVDQLLEFHPSVIRIFSRNEHNQYLAQARWKNHRNLRFLLGDVRDKDRLARACEDIDIVFHSAALKHVPACEYNPFEAVKTNVIGTQNLIDLALDNEIDKVIAINTDKSVSPINTMGATKLLSEKLIIAANLYKGSHRTRFASVRFGNVIGSDGSVLQLFIEQIKTGEPLTITHPDMERFIMTVPQAVKLTLRAGATAAGGEVFILKMPAVKITDLADALVELLAPEKAGQIKFDYVGRRPGEKTFEELLTPDESAYTEERDDMFVLRPFGEKRGDNYRTYSTHTNGKLSKDEIKQFFIEHALLEIEPAGMTHTPV
ncbi:MAG TPA: polysaccharide biosynthesis protein [Firmicutes bacterium]|nr:polysaccharide biosynthesis protein [Bacillota bacterium]